LRIYDSVDSNSQVSAMSSPLIPTFSLTLMPVYWLISVILLIASARSYRLHGVRNALFWLMLALLVGFADVLSDEMIGVGVLLVGALALLIRAPEPESDTGRAARHAKLDFAAESSLRLGKKLLGYVLLLPIITLAATLLLRRAYAGGAVYMDINYAPIFALTLACIALPLLLWAGRHYSGDKSLAAGTDMAHQIGWAMFLPLLLAILGTVYAKAGVGTALAQWLPSFFDVDNRYACVIAYGLGMALFTMLLGNAFVAFPVMTAAIAVPLVIARHQGDPVVVAALGMLSGYCGTLLSPLAANFNLVPAVLMNLDSPHAVIRAQVGTAVPLLACNLGLLCLLVYR
jgi:uncharacterized membrane protein